MKKNRVPNQRLRRAKELVYKERAINTGVEKLDLHGERARDAREKIEKFISDQYIAGTDCVEIVYGIGTGALREVVLEILNNDEAIKLMIESYKDFGASCFVYFKP